jgi:hypothetical protein
MDTAGNDMLGRNGSMMEGACHCGAVSLRVSRLPTYINDCQCTHCQKRGTLWAYFDLAEVEISGPTTHYMWGGKHITFHFCPTCGCTTHWSPNDPEGRRMGVNTRLLDRDSLSGIPIRQSPGPR